jgi:hypothetical protein
MRVLRRDPDTTDTIETTDDSPDDVTTAPVRPAPTRATTAPPPPPTTEPTSTTTEVEAESWSIADAVVAVVGAGLALVGAIALVRTGVDKSWFRPVVNVLDARHTALLGAIELGAGVLLMLSAPLRSRAPSALLGLGGAILAALAAIQNSDVQRELAIEKNWAWMLAGVGVFVAVASLVPPRRRRVERLVQS